MTRLSGIRGLLLDLDGVLVLQGRALPGAQDALRDLDRRGLPFHVVTNTSLFSRESLSAWGRSVGLDVPADRITSALSASAAYTAHAFPGQALYVIASEDARREFAGQRLLSNDEADAPDAEAAAVVVGDAPEEATYDNLNRAFRLIRRGARLIGMHKIRWWLTPAGPTLHSGAFVAGLEFAAGVRGMILGKPSPAFFREAADEILTEVMRAAPPGPPSLRPPRPRRASVLMVGDDLWTDVLAAQRLGLRGAFVLSGKHGQAELEQAARQPRGGGRPDIVAASLTEVIEALD